MIDLLQPGEHELIGDIIAEGFADDPVNLWSFRNPAVLRPLYTLMARDLYLTKGFGHVVDGGQAGSLWLAPGTKKHFGLLSTLTMAAHIAGKGGLTAVRNALRVDIEMSRKHPLEPHYYLFAIATRVDARGKGLGGQLMRATLERVDAERQAAYLENSKPENIGFYRHFGFEVVEELRAAPDAPPLFLMWRDAR
ncbi:ribosomal protein S18 acetylase RimI-like enzyme [Litorivivens lipolytica]|uniref:Ribosomal protein S18 acetylase RimI-like enzyme n=1 Tax=Litorivivens lipolytica TaxID=1524264 RepID=A0A7W4W4H9_9GAMM|nr:GNAT family N-acetyltransferase [Litorivivens lipolytica]MBB3047287.1 ribosomal protein S18 acetylase RimI-like enzyme [Litorivivens lipolytica]